MNDYQDLLKDMVDMLQAYITIKTIGNDVFAYQEAIFLFIQHANKDGLLYQKVMLDSGLPMLILTVEGLDQSLKSLVLNHHMDVVSAENKGWDYHPFQAVVADTKVYGRGTQDMKAIGCTPFEDPCLLHSNNEYVSL